MAESKADKAFREEVLAGTDPNTRDHPTRRARAAADYYETAATAAGDAAADAEAAVEKARAQLAATEDALATLTAAAKTARDDADRAARLADQVEAEFGPDPETAAARADDTRAEAGTATGKGV